MLVARGKPHLAKISAADFNTILDAEIDERHKRQWSDVWEAVRGNEPVLTWDPQTNPMASWLGVLRFSGARIDRVVFQSYVLLPTSITLIGVSVPTSRLDHYRLLAKFSMPRGHSTLKTSHEVQSG